MDLLAERRRIEAELDMLRKRRDELQDQLNRIIEITAGIIYVLNADGYFTFVNNAVEEILHYRPEELLGRHFSAIMSPSEYEKVGRSFVLPRLKGKVTGYNLAPKLFDERRSGQRKTKNLEVQLITKEQQEVKVFMGNVAGIIAAEGSYDRALVDKVNNKGAAFLGSQGIIFDITRFKSAEREKFEIQQRLFEVQKMDAIGRLAGGIAHDFNNKLATILGCADMIRQGFAKGNKELEACLEPIFTASWHAADLTNRLLDFSAKNKYQMVTINIHNIISTVIELLQHTIDRRITITHEFRADHPAMNGNPSRLQSLVLNLAVNACDAMATGGTLHLTTDIIDLSSQEQNRHPHLSLPGSYLRLAITDKGRGMDERLVKQLLDFFNSFHTIGEGIGMGLANAFDCIKDHEGSLDIASRPDEGTTISVFLPYLKVPAVAQAAETSDGEALRGAGTILLIDDETSLAGLTKQMLEDLGYSVTCCRDGEEAEAYYRTNASSIDLVLLDMIMPKVSGRDCYIRLKKINPAIKAILFTGNSFNEEAELILKEGVQGFIHKPFDLAHLSQVVARIMRAKTGG